MLRKLRGVTRDLKGSGSYSPRAFRGRAPAPTVQGRRLEPSLHLASARCGLRAKTKSAGTFVIYSWHMVLNPEDFTR